MELRGFPSILPSLLSAILLFSCLYIQEVNAVITIPGYDLPVFPVGVSSEYDPKATIPLDIHMTMKDTLHIDDDFMPFIKNNNDCTFHLNNDEQMDAFIDAYWAGTSVQWAFHAINPKLMASKADIWRLAVLWLRGGVYMDADSFLKTKISTVIQPTDRFVFGAENNEFKYCYSPLYHLNKTNTSAFADGKQIENWLLMSAPRHPFVTQTLHNLVVLVKRQYFEEQYLYEITREPFWKIICTTGPGVLTASISQVMYNLTGVHPFVHSAIAKSVAFTSNTPTPTSIPTDPANGYLKAFTQYRYAGVDWAAYGGVFKTWGNWKTNKLYSDKPHYYQIMEKGGLLLDKYAKDVVYFT